MARITRISATALAALAIGTPVATAMPIDASVRPQTDTILSPQSGVSDVCAPGSRPVHGPAGTGCTTSPDGNAAEYAGVLALGLGGAAVLAIALGARPGAGRRRGRASTAPAFSDRAS